MKVGKDLIQQIKEISLSSESVTREALIRRMKDSILTLQDPDNPTIIYNHCSITIMSEELSVFLRQNDLNFLSNLTDWYDSGKEWTYETKGSGKDSIQGVCVNLLGATAPDWIQTMLPQEAVGGGFTSRIIFIVEETKRKTVTDPSLTENQRNIRENLLNDLEQIIQLKGEMRFTDEAKVMYTNWYEEQDIKMHRREPPISDPRFAGYCERRPTHIKKICMILSASRGNSLMIDADDFERANKLLLKAEEKMDRTFGGLGSNVYGQATEKVLRYLEANGSVLRSDLMKQFYRDIDPTTLDIVEQTLEQMGVLKMTLIPDRNEKRYEYRK